MSGCADGTVQYCHRSTVATGCTVKTLARTVEGMAKTYDLLANTTSPDECAPAKRRDATPWHQGQP